MGRTKTDSKKPSEEKLPDWAEQEIKSVQFGDEQVIKRTGYILDTYENDLKIDIQLYEPLPDSRTIIEGLDVPKSMSIGDFRKGFVYEFEIKIFKGDLSARLVEFLKTNFSRYGCNLSFRTARLAAHGCRVRCLFIHSDVCRRRR